MLAALLIPLSLLCTCFLLQIEQPRPALRANFLKALILHAAAIILLTEALSVPRQLTRPALLVFWGGVVLGQLAWLCLRLKGPAPTRLLSGTREHVRAALGELRRSPLQAFCVAGTLAILAVCLATALIAPPNNYDSLTYHMPRVMHWLQNQSVEHFPTNNLRQISFQPGASYIVAQFQLLSGGDCLANLVQWTGFLGAILAVSLIAGGFGARAAALGGLVCASIPMAIMQSTTTQSDLLTGCWLACYAHFILRTERYAWADAGWMAASLGLAISTKATALFLPAPLTLLLLWRLLRQGRAEGRRLPALVQFCAVQAAALLLSCPHFLRNLATFGSWLGDDTGTRISEPGLFSFASNIVRNLALNFPFPQVWEWIAVHYRRMGLPLSAPADTYAGSCTLEEYLRYPGDIWNFLLPDDDRVASPLHIILFLGAALILAAPLFRRLRKGVAPGAVPAAGSSPALLWACAATGFLLFCALVKWMEWNNRLLLPLLILASPSIADCLQRSLPKALLACLAGLLALSGIGYSLTPIHHPLVALPPVTPKQSGSILKLTRNERYYCCFGERAFEIRQFHEAVAREMLGAGCPGLGLAQGPDDLEYPLWISLKALDPRSRIRHVRVGNPSRNAFDVLPEDAVCCVLERDEGGFVALRMTGGKIGVEGAGTRR